MIRDSEDPFSLGTKTPEIAELSDPGAPEFFTDLESSPRVPAVSSREDEEGCATPRVAAPQSVRRAEYEVPASIAFLSDGQRYEQPDDSLYLGEGEHHEYLEYSEYIETVLEEGGGYDPQCFVCDSEEEYGNEAMGFSSEDSSCYHDASENYVSVEEEENSAEGMETVYQLIKGLRRCHDIVDRGRDRANQPTRNLVFSMTFSRGGY